MGGRAWWVLAAAVALGFPIVAQTPQPFPRGGTPQRPAQPAAPAPAPSAPPSVPSTQTAASPSAPTTQTSGAPASPAAPTEAQLGFPLYPAAQFIASYDAGRGQRYYLFGTTAAFADAVTFYRTTLKERGRLIFEEPPTHWFEIGRFKEETMAFPPGVTVKDYTSGGSAGYPNTKKDGPLRFATVIQIVPQVPDAR